jgi:hypothetical protein
MVLSLLANRRQRVEQRLGHENHSRATTKWPVIDATVAVGDRVARVKTMQLDRTGLKSAAGNADPNEGLKEFWKQRDDVKTHGRRKVFGK